MVLDHSEESSNTTPTSAGFTNSNEGFHSRREYATSPSSDVYSQARSFRTATPPLLRAPVGHAFTSHVKSWGAPEIASFLSLYNCDTYTALFHNNDIDGKVLLDLDMASLKEIGISKIGDRVKLLGGVRDLRRRAARATPSLTLGASNVTAGLSSAEGNQIAALENDARGSQVQKRLATALVSKRLQLSRPPPLNLQRHRPQPVADSSMGVAVSPPLRSATPKSLQSQAFSKSLTSATDSYSVKGLPVANGESAATLKLPHSREHRRSPSPVVDETMWASALRPDPKVSDRRQAGGGARFGEVSNRGDNSGMSPTQYFVPGQREESLHPFASASRTNDAQASRDNEQRRALARHNLGQTSVSKRLSPVELASRFGSSTVARQPKSLEVLKRSIVKFVNSEDGTTRTVNVSGCTSGVEVLEIVLKKFSKTTSNLGALGVDVDTDNDTLEVDGWGVSIKAASGDEGMFFLITSTALTQADIPLTESALLDFCHGHHSTELASRYDPVAVREKRLLLRRVAHPLNRKNMEVFFGEVPPAPLSPNSPSHYSGPRLGRQSEDHDAWKHDSNTAGSKKMNRASTVSIMSGLGAPVPGAIEPAPSPNSARSSTNGNIASRTKRMYNFFGHRPPSELISNHLSEYFPSARKRDLEKTVRQSMLRLSQGQGDRQAAFGQPVPQGSPSTSSPITGVLDGDSSPKYSGRPQSTRTVSSSTTPAAIPEEGEAISARHSGGLSPGAVDNHPPLLPPFESTGESLVDSLQQFSPAPSTLRASLRPGRRGSSGSTLSRISVISSIRKPKDKTDSASLLTVDEITAEVENRRASMSTFNESVDSDQPVTPAAGSDGLPSEDDASDSDGEEFDADDASDPLSDDEGKDQGKAYTSTGCKYIILPSLTLVARRIIKWMKGALVGAGSFGSVFLGMDAQSGLLMAVKQVELPSGDVRNEERKRNMVQALEREIELLKELSHENIVQYLGDVVSWTC